MKTVLFTFDSVIYQRNAETERVARTSFSSEGLAGSGPVRVLVTGVLFDHGQSGTIPEPAGSRVFMEQILPGEKRSSMSMSLDRIREIFSLFPTGSILWCLPYGVAVEAYLSRQEQGTPEGVVMVLEEVCGLILLTVLEDGELVEMREFPSLDIPLLAEELRRSVRLCTVVDKQCIISNHSRLEELVRHTGWKIQPMDAGLVGLEMAEFLRPGQGFLPPEEKDRRVTRSRRRRVLLTGLGAAAIGLLFLGWSLFIRQGQSRMLVLQEGLKAEELELKRQLRLGLAETYRERLHRCGSFDMEVFLYQLVINMPPEWTIESLGWRTDAQGGIFSAVCIVNGEGDFGHSGVFAQRQVNRTARSGQISAEVSVRTDCLLE